MEAFRNEKGWRVGVEVTILKVITPNLFLIKEAPSIYMSQLGKDFLEMEMKIQSLMTKRDIVPRNPTLPDIGSNVLVKKSPCSDWYRARVVRIIDTGRDYRIEVLLLDYGSTLLTEQKWIRQGDHRMFTIPPQSVEFFLPGLKPLSFRMGEGTTVCSFQPCDVWDTAAVEHVRTLVSRCGGATVDVMGVTKSGRLYGKLELRRNGTCVSIEDFLVSDNYAFLDKELLEQEFQAMCPRGAKFSSSKSSYSQTLPASKAELSAYDLRRGEKLRAVLSRATADTLKEVVSSARGMPFDMVHAEAAASEGSCAVMSSVPPSTISQIRPPPVSPTSASRKSVPSEAGRGVSTTSLGKWSLSTREDCTESLNQYHCERTIRNNSSGKVAIATCSKVLSTKTSPSTDALTGSETMSNTLPGNHTHVRYPHLDGPAASLLHASQAARHNVNMLPLQRPGVESTRQPCYSSGRVRFRNGGRIRSPGQSHVGEQQYERRLGVNAVCSLGSSVPGCSPPLQKGRGILALLHHFQGCPELGEQHPTSPLQFDSMEDLVQNATPSRSHMQENTEASLAGSSFPPQKAAGVTLLTTKQSSMESLYVSALSGNFKLPRQPYSALAEKLSGETNHGARMQAAIN